MVAFGASQPIAPQSIKRISPPANKHQQLGDAPTSALVSELCSTQVPAHRNEKMAVLSRGRRWLSLAHMHPRAEN